MTRTLSVLIAVVVGGCGGPPPPPPVVAVVTLAGKPAAGLGLRLYADTGAAVANGATGPDGRAALSTGTDQPIPPGTYKVTVTDLGEAEEDPMAVTQTKPRKSRVTAAHGTPAKTLLTLTIEAGRNEYPIDIK